MIYQKNSLFFTNMLILLLIFVSVACEGGNDNQAENMNTNTINLSDWEKKLYLKFPKNTKVLYFKYSPGRDDAAYIKLNIPKQNWKDFIQNSLVSLDDLDNMTRIALDYGEKSDDGEWDPGKPKDLPTAAAMLPDGRAVKIGLDLSKENIAVVYIMWHEM